MNMRLTRGHILHLVLFVLVLSGGSHHVYSQTAGRETLLQTVPDDFKIGYKVSSQKMTMTEMVPKDETVEDWSEMVTTQIFYNSSITPPAFLRNIGAKWLGACPGSTHGKLNSGIAKGYPVSMLLLACPNNPNTGKPESVLIRVIQGKTTLYVVQYAFRSEASPSAINKASHYLAEVNVYDSGSNETIPADQTKNDLADQP